MLPLKRSTDPRIVLYIWLTHARPLPKTMERVFSPLTDFRFPPFMEQEFKFCPTSRLWFLGLCTAQSVDVFHASPFGVFLIGLLNMAGFMKFRSLIEILFWYPSHVHDMKTLCWHLFPSLKKVYFLRWYLPKPVLGHYVACWNLLPSSWNGNTVCQ